MDYQSIDWIVGHVVTQRCVPKVHSMDKMFKEIEVAKIDLGKLLEELDKEQG